MTAKKGCIRPIGQSVIQAVETLERMGKTTLSAGRPEKHQQRSATASKSLRRAVQYGLATRSEHRPYVYKAAADWREALKAPVEPPSFKREGRPFCSVWDMAARS